MKVLKCGVMLLSILFVSQLHVYAEENRWTWPVEGILGQGMENTMVLM